MKFEKIIKTLSSSVAGFAIFVLASGMYLSFKGYDIKENGEIVLSENIIAKNKVINLDSRPILPTQYTIGNKNAPITIYEYSSLGCYHCATFHLKVFPLLKEKYIDTGKVRLSFVNFPIDQRSMQSAQLASCFTGDKYFSMIKVLFENQVALATSNDFTGALIYYGQENGLGKEKLESCLASKEQENIILANREQALDVLNLKVTPTFVVSSSKGMEVLSGAQSFSAISSVIEKILTQK